MDGGEIPLDPYIRNWVLLPIVIVMFFVPILKQHIAMYLQGEKTQKLTEIGDRAVLMRAYSLRRNGGVLSASSFESRRNYLAVDEKAPLKREVEAFNPMQSLMDPNNGMEMMKKNISMVLSQVLLMMWVNHFFSGFVVVKLPFPLTLNFKAMLQRGIEITSLDVGYVSTLSWYFLTMFGLQGITGLIVSNHAAPQSPGTLSVGTPKVSAAQMDVKQAFERAKDDLMLANHTALHQGWGDVEQRLMKGSIEVN